jgi:hypothetical protein
MAALPTVADDRFVVAVLREARQCVAVEARDDPVALLRHVADFMPSWRAAAAVAGNVDDTTLDLPSAVSAPATVFFL